MASLRIESIPHRRLAVLIATAVGIAITGSTAAAQDRLIDREPFDRIVLDRANQNRQLDILPDAFPDRTLPDPLPRSGTLRVRLMARPLDEFDIRWANITEVLLFEQLVLEEAKQLARDGRYAEAHDYFSYLQRYHRDLPGLGQAVESVLELEIADAYKRGDYERAWMVLTALYDRNAEHSGISQAFGNITSRLLQAHVSSGEFGRARRLLELLRDRFGEPGSAVAERWDGRLRELADEKLQSARGHLDAGRLDDARESVRAALAVAPDLPQAQALWREIAAVKPRLVVGVLAEAPDQRTDRLDDWPSRRIEALIAPALVELRGFGAEGGEYRSRYGEVLQQAGGLATTLVLPQASSGQSPAPDAVARRLIALAQRGSRGLGDVLADQLAEIALEGVQTVRLQWQHAHVRPEALLRIDVSSGTPFGPFEVTKRTSQETIFVRKRAADAPGATAPVEIVERLFDSDDDAVDALIRGEVDIVERIAPSQRARLAQHGGIEIDQYALPTLHVLVPSTTRPLLKLSELRRAILYAIDRQAIAEQLFFGAGSTESARVISGPFAPGSSFTDPIGYAYDRAIEPRPFDPRLAATLATVAARLHSADRKGEGEGEREGKEVSAAEAGLPELVVGHPREPLARAICQTIAAQLEAVGIPVRLEACDVHELDAREGDFDLRYAELAMWEPVVDARRLLGPRGELGSCSPRMGLALAEVEQASTWPEVRESLHGVHRVAFDELSVIPLWQTTNYFAYADVVQGLAPQPVSLYQNIETWRLERAMEGTGQ